VSIFVDDRAVQILVRPSAAGDEERALVIVVEPHLSSDELAAGRLDGDRFVVHDAAGRVDAAISNRRPGQCLDAIDRSRFASDRREEHPFAARRPLHALSLMNDLRLTFGEENDRLRIDCHRPVTPDVKPPPQSERLDVLLRHPLPAAESADIRIAGRFDHEPRQQLAFLHPAAAQKENEEKRHQPSRHDIVIIRT
jgi:hypothetical protein